MQRVAVWHSRGSLEHRLWIQWPTNLCTSWTGDGERDHAYRAPGLPEEAQKIGLINRAVPIDNWNQPCARSPTPSAVTPSIAASKYTIQILTDKEDRDYDEISRLSQICVDSSDYKEGREAFMEKRSPVFTGS